MKKCPICKTLMKSYEYYDSISSEEMHVCADGCEQYEFNYCYGYGYERIGNLYINLWHGYNKARRRKNGRLRKDRILRMRKKFKNGNL